MATQAGGRVQVDTEHVRVRTDLSEKQAKELAEDLQRHRDALVETSFKCGSAKLTQPLPITFFANEGDFDALAPRDAHAVVEPSKTGLAELPAELLMKSTQNRRVLRQAALHEMTHALSAECYPGLPPWLSEGLSLFHETVEIEGDALVAGRQKYAIVHQGEMPNEMARAREEIMVVPDAALPRLSELLAFEFGEFYRYIDYFDAFQERENVLLLGRYAGAWALTHALLTADVATYSRLHQFMLELRFGEASTADAWRSTMSGIDINLHYEDWTSIHVRYPTIALGLEDSHPPVDAVVRSLTEAEVELHLAARWNWNNDDGGVRAIEHLDRSIELDPNAPEPYLVRAALSDATGAEAQAAAWLSRAADLAPDDPSVLRSELVLRIREPEVPLKTNRDIEQVAILLESRAITAPQYDALARDYLETKHDTMSARYWAARALRRNPSCAVCRVRAGDVLSAAGQPTLAASMYRRALNRGTHDPAFERQRVLESMKVAASAAP